MQFETVNQMKTVNSPMMVAIDDDELHHLQAVLLMILDDITSFCDEQDIDYVLSGGSALGAVRHEGFIPWDDDVDIDMPRVSYDRFIESFAQRFPGKYFIQAPEQTPYVGTSISRVRLQNTTMRMHDDCALDECGIFIDIFPIENVPEGFFLRSLHGFACYAVGFLYACRRFWRDRAFYRKFAGDNRSFRRSINAKATLGLPLACIPMDQWTAIVLSVYSWCKDSNSSLVAVPSGRHHYRGELFRRDQFAESRTAQFEGRQVRIPRDVEAYLEKMYGDWKRIPKPEERERHAYLELDFGSY